MIRTRFAPSPTGFLHIGGLRSAVYPYALAKHSGGKFILRIEDTDQKRQVKGAVESLQKILLAFGLVWDEEHIQSERVKSGIYKKAADQLVASGHAYKDEGAIRIKIPVGEEISYHDYILDKDISWKSDVLTDMVLLKSDGFPTYHLAVVVDDHDMGVTHVLRGHDWLPSTPIHLLIYKFLGYDQPEIGHLTDILDPDGSGKLSKRKGSSSVEQLLANGYLPEAILNFVILLGWAPKDNRELFTLDEFVQTFDPSGFQKSNPIFNQKKLDWFNGQYIRSKSDSELLQLIKPYLPEVTPEIIPLIKDRLTTLADAKSLAGFFFTRPRPSEAHQGEGGSDLPNLSYLNLALEVLSDVTWSKEAIDTALLAMCDKRKIPHGDFFMSLRLAICGSKITPPLTESMLILGKDETLARLKF
ncbi:MAG: glutamate--tRNA ligase family protein [Patescibacteria group bacterium]